MSPPAAPTVYYLPEFLIPADQEALLQAVDSVDEWTSLRRRRLQQWGGTPLPEGMQQEPLPPYLTTVIARLVDVFGVSETPNHVLINEYTPGQGIMPHRDGPLYHPRVAILSLGGTVAMDLNPPQGGGDESLQVVLRPGSLLIFEEDVYEKWMHGIAETGEDIIGDHAINAHLASCKAGDVLQRDRRVSLTIRHVLNVVAAGP